MTQTEYKKQVIESNVSCETGHKGGDTSYLYTLEQVIATTWPAAA